MMKSKKKLENTSRQMEMKKNPTKLMRCRKSSSKREVQSDTGLPQEMRKISNKQPKPPPKIIRKRRTNKTQSQKKEGYNKDQRRNK